MSPDDDGYIGYVLSDVARLIRTVFDRRVRSLGLTRAQWLVLTRLYRRPGASQTELADMLEVDRASAGRMIDRMEKGHWVERRADAGDRRIKRLYLTLGSAARPCPHVGDRRSDGRRCAGAAVAAGARPLHRPRGAREGAAADHGRRRRGRSDGRRPRRPSAHAAPPRHESPPPGAAAPPPAGRRAADRHRRRRLLVAVGRPLRRHRQCLCEGAHRADRAGGGRHRAPRAGARPCHRLDRRHPADARDRARSGWRSTAPRPNSTRRGRMSRACAAPGARW